VHSVNELNFSFAHLWVTFVFTSLKGGVKMNRKGRKGSAKGGKRA